LPPLYHMDFPTLLSLDDVLLIPQASDIASRSQVDLSWKLNHYQFSLPLISSNMDSVTGVDMAIAMAQSGGLSILPRFDIPEVQSQKVRKIKDMNLPVAAAIGIKDGEWRRLELLVAAGVDHISLDVAHGHLLKVTEIIKKIRQSYPQLSLSAGVVGTYQAALDLFKAGADIVRVGVGPGSICTTRIQTGCGVPQFSAILETAKAARKMGKTIWADGGTKNSGDVVKCLAAGASAVILGYQIAGATETPSKLIEINGQKYKTYNGSTCLTEKKKQVSKNGSDKDKSYTLHIEGVEGMVPFRGPVKSILDSIAAGIRSGYSYCGAQNTQEIWAKAVFCRVTPQGLRESAAHDIITSPLSS